MATKLWYSQTLNSKSRLQVKMLLRDSWVRGLLVAVIKEPAPCQMSLKPGADKNLKPVIEESTARALGVSEN